MVDYRTQAVESVKMETTAGRDGTQVLLYSSRQFSAHPKSSLARIDKRAAQAARNTRYRYTHAISVSDSTTKALSMQQKNGGTLFRNFKCEEDCGSRKAC